MASPTFSLTDILIKGRQTNSQVIVSGVPSRREKKGKDAWSQVSLEDLSHVQSRRNVLKYLVRVEMASDWFTRIYRSILAEQISSKIEIWRAN